jgi:hypothetical protein
MFVGIDDDLSFHEPQGSDGRLIVWTSFFEHAGLQWSKSDSFAYSPQAAAR